MHWTARSRAATDCLTVKCSAEANKLDEKLAPKREDRTKSSQRPLLITGLSWHLLYSNFTAFGKARDPAVRPLAERPGWLHCRLTRWSKVGDFLKARFLFHRCRAHASRMCSLWKDPSLAGATECMQRMWAAVIRAVLDSSGTSSEF